MPRMAAQTTKTDDLPFEDALTKLEALVEGMEDGEVPLAELVERFEQGSALLRLCQKRLGEAELRIEALKNTEEGLALETVTD